MAAPTHTLTSPLIQSKSNLRSTATNFNCLKPYSSLGPSSSSSSSSFSSSLSWLSTNSTHMTKLSLYTSIPKPRLPSCCAVSATVVSSMPTANPEGSPSSEKVPKWTFRGYKALNLARLEARKMKLGNAGTDSLLMGLLIEGTNLASKFLWANGITPLRVREEAIKLRGEIDLLFLSPEQPPWTEDAQKAIDWAIDHRLKSGDNEEVTTTDLLLGIWSVVEAPGHKILATLGFNDEKAKELESLSSGPRFVDG